MDATTRGEMIQELAEVFGMEPEAQALLESIGFPRERLPVASSSAWEFWGQAVTAIELGMTPGGIQALLQAVIERFPYNPRFHRWTGSAPDESSPEDLAEKDVFSRLLVEGPDQKRFELIDVPTSTTPKDLARAVASEYQDDNWPRDQDGQLQPPLIDHRTPDGTSQRLEPNGALHESGVRNGDTLHIANFFCFPGETQISLWNGDRRPIAEIQEGDVILSGMPERPEAAEVTKVFRGSTESLLKLDSRLRVTASHLVFANGRWTPAGELAPGDRLVDQNGALITLSTIERLTVNSPIFNLHLDSDDHTFFANGILVHNMDSKTLVADDQGEIPPDRPLPFRLTRDARGALAGFHTDVPSDEDLLGIRGEVEALASLVAAWSVEPPLSIGLFGDWGMGKSFFLRQLRSQVDRLTAGARNATAPQREIAFYRHVVQIEFNAWHYAEGNLWASLVEHIFTHLHQTDGKDESGRLRQDLLQAMEVEKEIKARIEGQLQALKTARDEAQTRFQDAQKHQHDLSLQLAAKQAASIWSDVLFSPDDHQRQMLARLGLPSEVIDSARALRDALRDVQTLSGQTRAMTASIFQGLKRPGQFWLLVAVILAAPAAVLLLSGIANLTGWPIWDLLSRGVVQAATLLAGGVAWVRRQAARASEALKTVAPIREEIEKQVAVAEAAQAREIAALQAALDRTTSEYAAVLQQYEETERRLRDLQAELERSLDPGRMLAAFIEDRAACSDYRRHLGVVALIRRDFEKLARLFQDQREAERQGIEPRDKPTINRIALYVDDLDRCPPERVVEVLQAIHLLLAFPLFVVIVAVDARWVSRSLQQHYGRLLGRKEEGNAEAPEADEIGAAEPEDYLEKIFQIPYWLRPMSHDHCAGLLDGLTRDSLAKPLEEPTEPSTPAWPRLVPSPAEPSPEPAAEDSAPEPPREAPPVPEARPSEPAERVDLSPRKLEIAPEELAFMKKMAPLIGRSPRRVKRFLNCYRLIRAGLRAEVRPPAGTGAEDDSFDYRAIMLLLAVVTGEREAAEPFAQALAAHGPADSLDELIDKIGENPAIERLKNALERYRDESGFPFGGPATLEPLLQVLPEVVRYSFRPIVLP